MGWCDSLPAICRWRSNNGFIVFDEARISCSESCSATWRQCLAEMCTPQVVVAYIDDAVVVAVGAQIRLGRACFAPHHIVGGIDDAVEVVVARKRVGLRFECAEIDSSASFTRPRRAALVILGHSACAGDGRGIAGVAGRAPREKRVGERWPAVA